MTQITTTKQHAVERGPHGEPAPAGDESFRLQVLVGELLSENQRLRFENDSLRARAEQLKQEAQSTEHGLKQTTKWVGMMV